MKERTDIQKMLVVNTLVFHLLLVPYFADDVGIAFAVALNRPPPSFHPVFVQVSRCMSYTNRWVIVVARQQSKHSYNPWVFSVK